MTTSNSSNTIANAPALPFEMQATADGTILVLRGRLGVQQARPLWDCLQPALLSGTAIQLNAQALDGMDTSILQILCRAAKDNAAFTIGAVSEQYNNALRDRGLENWFAVSTPIVPTLHPVPPPPSNKASTQPRAKRKKNA